MYYKTLSALHVLHNVGAVGATTGGLPSRPPDGTLPFLWDLIWMRCNTQAAADPMMISC